MWNQLGNPNQHSRKKAKRPAPHPCISLILSLVSFPTLLFMIYSILLTLLHDPETTNFIPDVDLTKCPPISSNTKRLWAYWHTGFSNAPLFIQQNLKMWTLLTPGWELRVIQGTDPGDECHVSQFVPRELLPRFFDDLVVQIQSDAARLALIRLYGGIYMDSTLLLFEPLELNYWKYVDLPKDDPEKKHLVGYYYKEFTLPGRHDGIEIWMIVATAQDPLIIAWHNLFLKLEEEGPNPFIRNETTGELNTLFEGVDFSKLSEKFLNYGASTTCLHALLQLNPEMNHLYENKSILYDAEVHAYRLLNQIFYEMPELFSIFFSPRRVSVYNLNRIVKDTPLMKLIHHAKFIPDYRYDEWRNVRSNLGIIFIKLFEKSKRWREEGVWEGLVFNTTTGMN